eukprot:scaffold68588_cov47-Phaeocystis_antarctica.AAC.2
MLSGAMLSTVLILPGSPFGSVHTGALLADLLSHNVPLSPPVMRCWRFPPVIPPLDTTWATDVQQDAYLPCLLRCTAPARSAARPDHTARPDCLAATPTRVCSLRASQPAVPRCPGAG